MKLLFKAMVGSHLYGLNTENSDMDYVGVYLPDTITELITPFKTNDEIDESVISKQDNNKNDSDAVDCKLYRLDKFIKLLADNNPNIIEMLFIPEDKIVYIEPLFKEYFIDKKDLFLSKRVIDKFIGYAISQERKSYIKTENLKELDDFYTNLLGIIMGGGEGFQLQYGFKTLKDLLESDVSWAKSLKHDDEFLYIGDIKLYLNVLFSEAARIVSNRIDRASHRKDDIMFFNYDPKFMSHTIRLLDEGFQLLKNGRIDFPFKGLTYQRIMDIKMGKTDIADIPKIVETYKEKLKALEEDTNLPDRVNINKIEELYVDYVCITYGLIEKITWVVGNVEYSKKAKIE